MKTAEGVAAKYIKLAEVWGTHSDADTEDLATLARAYLQALESLRLADKLAKAVAEYDEIEAEFDRTLKMAEVIGWLEAYRKSREEG